MRNSERTEEVYRLIESWPREHGHPPSYRELAAAVDCTVSTVHWHIANLVAEGRVTSDPGKNRTLRVVPAYDTPDTVEAKLKQASAVVDHMRRALA